MEVEYQQVSLLLLLLLLLQTYWVLSSCYDAEIVRHYQEYKRNSRGVQLFTCRWLPFSSPKALVFLCHGISLSLSLSLSVWWVWMYLIHIDWRLQGMAWSAAVSWEVMNILKCLHLSLCLIQSSAFQCLCALHGNIFFYGSQTPPHLSIHI